MRVIDNNGGGGTRSVSLTEGSRPDEQSAKRPQNDQAEGTPAETKGPSSRDLEKLWHWNRHVPPLLETCIHDMVSEKARTRPEALAVQSWDGSLTYAELEDLSSRLSRHLISVGITVGTQVPLCFEKSVWATVALLGTMKSGAAFSLTDPSQPEARLQTIVEQTGAKLVMTSSGQKGLGQRIAGGHGNVVVISRDFFENQRDRGSEPLPSVPPSSPMYIIFTSGSTGKPKGVVISHQTYASGAVPRAHAVGYKESSRVFDFPSYAFDVSIDCMLCTLAMGGTVCVPSEESRMNDLSGAIRDSKANMVHMTPSVARVLDSDIIPSLDVLGLGGEAVSSNDAATWSQYTNLVIAYGPSECTVGCTINNTVTVSTGIGKGVGGVTWIVDPEDHNRLVDVGAVGELLIEGPVVGDGYLDEPEKTAQVFIEDPIWLTAGHSNIPGRHGRLYKTGDLVRYEPILNGSIQFVGRKDQQVKLRGQRVELAEVEHHLQACLPSGVKVAAEVVKPDHGAPTLVAFLSEPTQPSDSPEDDLMVEASVELNTAISAIDSTMGSRVPRYMIPAAFVPLREMPSLVSRKIDRKKLREVGSSIPRDKLSRSQVGATLNEAPGTEAERQLQRAWARVLDQGTEIYRQSSFFQLGGDSLRAMRLVATARDENLVLTVANVFTYPTLAEMAARTTKASEETRGDISPFSLLEKDWSPGQACQDAAGLCGIDPEAVEDIYPCTPLQEALMALSAKVKEAYVAQRVVELDGKMEGEKLIRAFDMAQGDCPILQTRIVQVPGRGLVQVLVRGRLQWQSGSKLDEYLVADREESMDLGKPLVRYALIDDCVTGKVSFVLTMHHALYDGWSMPLVVARVNKAYHGETMSRPAGFKHFIQYLMSQDKSESEKFWRERLHKASGPQFPSLPWSGYQAQADSLLEVYVPLEGRSAANSTVATIIRAAWALVASHYINTGDIVFGETLTGRNAPVIGAEEIEGPMITTVPVRIQVDRNASVFDYLQGVQEQTVAQIPHEHFGLQHIRRVSPDALEACELRTGLVLHPSTADEQHRDDSPADRLVPAGDAEAAQEALKFNTYALMLVCSIDPRGFLIMASFDSRTVERPVMERVLGQLKQVSQQMHGATTAETTSITDIACLTDDDLDKIGTFGQQSVSQPFVEDYPGTTAVYIADPRDANRLIPVGGIGEVLLSSSGHVDLPEIPAPGWVADPRLEHGQSLNRLYKTGRLAKYMPDGTLSFTSDATAKVDAVAMRNQAPAKRVQASSWRQKKLRKLWSRVLRLPEEDVGLNDSFFHLGGDSIAAMKLVSEARLESITLTVMQVFQKRTLYDMATVLKVDEAPSPTQGEALPFSLIGKEGAKDFVENIIRPQLANPNWEVADVIPLRPLQEVAVKGTTHVPRFSARYELMYFGGAVDRQRLIGSCEQLIQRNEILRTVFIEHQSQGYGVVLEKLEAAFVDCETDGDLEEYSKKVCHADVLEEMPLGSAFVKWFLVRTNDERSCLIFRLSHAQYDEICLPLILRQLSALYEGKELQKTVPFSSYVGHLVRNSIPRSIEYWKDLLQGSSMTVLRPGIPVEERNHFAIEKTIDISKRPRETTVATLPTAAWALCLARRLSIHDVTFGEVVSGRNMEFPNADMVVGPCWQYIPVRVKFDSSWTGIDLLNYIQHQHVASSAHEGMGLKEIVENCTNWPSTIDWYDSVVHQDVEHVENLGFSTTGSRMETVYPHEEPLREWKIQAFFSGDRMTLEIVTFSSWASYARELLDDIIRAAQILVEEPRTHLFS